MRPDDTIESTLTRMQDEGATIYLVDGESGSRGLITLEDILEQVVGRIEDEYPHDPGRRRLGGGDLRGAVGRRLQDQGLSLPDTVAAGGIVLDLEGSTPEQVIRELAAVIPVRSLPADAGIAELALERETELPTDLGNGVAIPHARCAQLRAPLIVLGRSRDGVIFSPESKEPVRLVLLLVTPAERPDTQLSLVAKVAAMVGDAADPRAPPARDLSRRGTRGPHQALPTQRTHPLTPPAGAVAATAASDTRGRLSSEDVIPLASLPPGVLRDLLGGMEAPSPFVFPVGNRLFRFSSSSLFAEGYYVSPWWFTEQDIRPVFERLRQDPGTLSSRARGLATIPTVWNGNSNLNFLDLVVSVQLKETVDAFRGPGKDQTIAVYGKGTPREHEKVMRAPRDAMQNFLPLLSWGNRPAPSLVVAHKVFLTMSVCPIDRFQP